MTLLALAASVGLGPGIDAQSDEFVPVTDAMLQNPSPDDWLMWRRTLDGWGYSPLDQIDRDNVSSLRLVWSRAITGGKATPSPGCCSLSRSTSSVSITSTGGPR